MFRSLQKLIIIVAISALVVTPSQAMFVQPDWLDVTEPGVGTNRYAYSHNDPINKMDPNGNFAISLGIAIGIGIGLLAGGWAVDNAVDYGDDGQLNGSSGLGITSGLIVATEDLFGSDSSSESDSSSSGGGTSGGPNNDDDDEPSDKEKQKANHIFGTKNLAKHGLRGLLSKFPNPIEATRAIRDATQSALDDGQISVDPQGLYSTDISVNGVNVTVEGRVMNGIAELGTAYAK